MLLMLSGGVEKLNRSLGKWRLIDIIDGSHAIYTGWLGKPTVREREGMKEKGNMLTLH